MNQSASRPRLTRGAHDPKAFAYNIVGLFSQILPLLAYLGRTLNDTMCDHDVADICDRCQRKLYTVGTLISGSASAVAHWEPARLARLNARLALAAARRLVDTVELGEPVAWAMKGGAVVTTARRAINAGTALMDGPELGAMNEANYTARQCGELDHSTSRVARKHGLKEESYIIGFVLKAAAKAAEAAVNATEATWAQDGEARQLKLVQATEDTAGAALGAAIDGAALLLGTGRSESMMVVASGVCAEFDRLARPAGDDTPTHEEYVAMHGKACEKSTSQNAISGASPVDAHAAAVAKMRANLEAEAEEQAAARRARNRCNYAVETPTEEHTVIYPEDAGAAAAEAAEPQHAEAAYREAYADAAELWDRKASHMEAGAEAFEKSELADVADEAIGDAAALMDALDRAERIMNAIAEEHRPVEAWTRRTAPADVARAAGVDNLEIEYQAQCCIMCRDAKGQPMLAPCRTRQILESYGEL